MIGDILKFLSTILFHAFYLSYLSEASFFFLFLHPFKLIEFFSSLPSYSPTQFGSKTFYFYDIVDYPEILIIRKLFDLTKSTANILPSLKMIQET